MTPAEKMAFAKSKGVNVTDVKISVVTDGETTEVAVDSSKIPVSYTHLDVYKRQM